VTALRLLADENLNRVIVTATIRQEPSLEFLVATELGLAGQPDPVVLDHAAQHGLAVVTHDVRTMIAFAQERISRGDPMPGLFLVPQGAAPREVAESLAFLWASTTAEEWLGQIMFLPL
jgi:predicted nuclease of predicted toxin-antitoxin system